MVVKDLLIEEDFEKWVVMGLTHDVPNGRVIIQVMKPHRGLAPEGMEISIGHKFFEEMYEKNATKSKLII